MAWLQGMHSLHCSQALRQTFKLPDRATHRTATQTPSQTGRICRLCKCQASQVSQHIPPQRRASRQHGRVALKYSARSAWLQRATAQEVVDQQTEAPASAARDSADPEDHSSASSPLQMFLQWLAFQGVDAISSQNDRFALYTTDTGDRGLICMAEEITPGEVLLRMPLSLALTDHVGDQESNQLMYDGAPWAVRLACKILREKAKGHKSPWHPYLQILPERVPSPLQGFADTDMAAAELPDMLEQLQHNKALVHSAYQQLSQEASGGASLQEFEWAVSIVHSRTFGNASPAGGVGVHMLIPLVDMLNHSGDETALGDLSQIQPTSNVRWDVKKRPEGAPRPGFDLEVTATRPIQKDEELLLSYGERDNDDFFTHYGFVPPRNPHDDVVIFEDLLDLLVWHKANIGLKDASKREKQVMYKKAEAAGNAQSALPAGDPFRADASPLLDPLMQQQQQKLRVYNRGLVDERMAAALTQIGMTAAKNEEEAQKYAMTTIIMRCCQLLLRMTPLVDDLNTLADDPGTEPEEAAYYRTLLSMHAEALQQLPYTQRGSANPASQTTTAGLTYAQRAALTYRVEKKLILASYAKMLPGSLEDPHLLQQQNP